MSTWHPSTCARCYIFSSPLELHSTFSSHSSIRTTFYHACVLLFASLVLLTNFPHQALRLKWKWISCHVMRHWLQNEWHWEKLFHVVVDAPLVCHKVWCLWTQNSTTSVSVQPVAASELIFAHEHEVNGCCLEQKRNRPNSICCYLFVRGHLNVANGLKRED